MLRRLNTLRQLWRCQKVGARVRVYGQIWVHGDGEIEIGDDSVLDARLAPIELRTAKGGKIRIGNKVRIEGGASLEAEGLVELRDRVLVQSFAKIIDNHFHRITGDRHERPPAGEVVLEEDVIIGSAAILLPGSYIGKGTRVGARSVLSKRVPAGVRISGNPGKIEGPVSGR